MSKIPGCRVVSGTYGKVFWDGDLLFEIESFESKVTTDRKDMHFAGDIAADSKMTAIKGDGTMKIKKVFARVQQKLALAFKQGKDPRSQLISSVSDPDAFGTERVVINNVWFTEATLQSFTVGDVTGEDIPFGFGSDYDFPDLIPVQ